MSIEILGIEVGGTVVTIDFVGGYIEVDLLYGDARAWKAGELVDIAGISVPLDVLEIQLSADAFCILSNAIQCSALG